MANDEPVASRTRSQTTANEPFAARTRQALGSSHEMSAFADVKDDKTLNEWLHEIAFVTTTMSHPDNRILTWLTANPPWVWPENTPTRWV